MKIPARVLVAALIVVAGVTALASCGAHPDTAARAAPTPPAQIASTPTPTPTSPPSPAPTATPPPVGTHWTCTSDQTAAGAVDHSEDGRIQAEGGVRSALCQKDIELAYGAHAFRIPVGHFAPYRFCGITVANIIDPYQPQLPPSRWTAADYLQFDEDWNAGAPSGTC